MMAQVEDTELRDLVLEALEKNGSLAKIRALLRANVFLAFENECENIKQNVSLDNILKLPEGILCLSIIHEFLEFCNLKNTLFVYMAESRQKKEYVYEGQKVLAEKLNLRKDNLKEPILVTLLRNVFTPCHRKYSPKKCDSNLRDEQNCTYIVHEDSSSSTSNSENSSDEKNKHRTQLDNSDTDTSSDSTRDKSSSEYIPNEHLAIEDDNMKSLRKDFVPSSDSKEMQNAMLYNEQKRSQFLHELKLINSSSDSTSYVDLKPFNLLDKNMLNTTGVPFIEADEHETTDLNEKQLTSNLLTETLAQQTKIAKVDHSISATMSARSSVSVNTEDEKYKSVPMEGKNLVEDAEKSDVETAEYSFDFSSSLATRNKDNINNQIISPESVLEEFVMKSPKNTSLESHKNSQSSQSSVSISDVADLISEKGSLGNSINNENLSNNKYKQSISGHSENISNRDRDKLSDDSGDFSESPIPSLSNLSLDVHSD